mgnify:CR=1 FL=1
MSGPMGIPWSTFGAFLVVVGSIVLAIVWALRSGDGDGEAR